MLEIEIIGVRGWCPVHKVGDKIVLEKTDALCIHTLSTLLHHVVALDEGVEPAKLGLTKQEDREHAYMQYVDPWKPYIEGGTVIFRAKKIR
jgi:uncharacterized repeat protein (TIGR04076 family)